MPPVNNAVLVNDRIRDFLHAENRSFVFVEDLDHLLKDGLACDDDIIAEQDGKRFVADKVAGSQDGVSESERLFLADKVNVRDFGNGFDHLQEFVFALALKLKFKLNGAVEVIFNRTFVAPRDDDNVFDARRRRLLDDVLNRRLVDNRKHLFGL